jgi:hypothetical protein
MKITSLRSIDGIAFGSSRAVLADRARPVREKVNRRGETELAFEEIIFRFAGHLHV